MRISNLIWDIAGVSLAILGFTLFFSGVTLPTIAALTWILSDMPLGKEVLRISLYIWAGLTFGTPLCVFVVGSIWETLKALVTNTERWKKWRKEVQHKNMVQWQANMKEKRERDDREWADLRIVDEQHNR